MNPVIPAAVACAIGLAQAPANGATLEVHTTAIDANQRLAPTSGTAFVPGTQPPEGDISVFVDPAAEEWEVLRAMLQALLAG